MKMRELSMGGKQAILKLRKEEKSIRDIGQTLGVANNNLKCPEKERNYWYTEQQTWNRSAKKNNSS